MENNVNGSGGILLATQEDAAFLFSVRDLFPVCHIDLLLGY